MNINTITTTSFNKHQLHNPTRNWPQSNCAVDLWIELLHNWGHDPCAGLAFCVGLDYEGDQFTFFKFPVNDLERLYDVKLLELSIYDNLEQRVAMQVARNNIVLMEVDGFYLPDTIGVSYQNTHTKTTIGINYINTSQSVLGYFHNDVYGVLENDNYKTIMGLINKPKEALFPYTEFVKQRTPALNHDVVEKLSQTLFEDHIRFNIPKTNPIAAFRSAFPEQVAQLSTAMFHDYAFNSFRMLGANFELFSSYLEWLNSKQLDTSKLAFASKEISSNAKLLQFRTARTVKKQKFDACAEIFDKIENSYNTIMQEIKG